VPVRNDRPHSERGFCATPATCPPAAQSTKEIQEERGEKNTKRQLDKETGREVFFLLSDERSNNGSKAQGISELYLHIFFSLSLNSRLQNSFFFFFFFPFFFFLSFYFFSFLSLKNGF
jgi:hypothetical protein